MLLADPRPPYKVLVAFSTTSILAFFATVIGYLFNAIRDRDFDDPLLNSLDDYFLRTCKSLFHLNPNRVETNDKLSRSIALERFVLALSDQQIVTGLAIFITGYSARCTISTYHFFIVTALGWFSFTTHLSTLTLLKPHFRNAPVQKFLRLLAIIATCIMLFIGLLVLYTTLPFGTPARCRFSHILLHGTKTLNYVVAVLLFSVLSITFVSKALRFSLKSDGRLGSTFLPQASQNGTTLISKEEYCSRKLKKISQSSTLSFLTYAHGYYMIFTFVYTEFLSSFLWELSALLFWNFYGIRQLLWARIFVGHNEGVHKIGDEEDHLNFGQLLALLLLALPILSAIETFQGMMTFIISRPHWP